jgi:hypothetical protein
MHHKSLLAILISSSLLLGCGSSDKDAPVIPPDTGTPDTGVPVTPPVMPPATEYNHTVAGLAVYQGALSGADICVDINKNLACDPTEPSSVTDAQGQYQVDWKSAAEQEDYYLIASWTASSTPAPMQVQALPLKIKNQHVKAQNVPAIDQAGQGRLYSTPEYSGAINGLTHTKLMRVLDMISQDLSATEITTLSAELDALLAVLYERDVADLYQVSAEASASDKLTQMHYALAFVEKLIAEKIPNVLAAEQILTTITAKLWQVFNDSGLLAAEFFTQDSLDANIVVSSAAIALGFTETPLDNRIMSAQDWDIVLSNILNDAGFGNTFSLSLASNYNSVSLLNSDNSEHLIAIIDQDSPIFVIQAPVTEPDENEGDNIECWNGADNKWYTENNAPVVAPVIEGNRYTTRYSGTEVAINFDINKITDSANSEFWQSVINLSPAILKLDTLTWPETLYQLNITQTADVMCRIVDNYAYFDLPDYDSPEKITTSDIARIHFPSYFPDYMFSDDAKQEFTLLAADGSVHQKYRMTKSISPNNQLLFAITAIVEGLLPENEQSDYLLVDGQYLIEVEINKAMQSTTATNTFNMSFAETTGFNQTLYQHLLQQVKP